MGRRIMSRARKRHGCPAGRQCKGENGARAPPERPAGPVGAHVPSADGTVVARGVKLTAVGRKGQVGHRSLTAQKGRLLVPAGHIPEFDGVVVAGRCEQPGVGRKNQFSDPALVTAERQVAVAEPPEIIPLEPS